MANIVLTGGNRGIGLELARQACKRGDTVVVGVRRSSSELDRLGCKVITEVDVTSDESVGRFAAAVGEALGAARIDVLINNAGILERTVLGELDFDAVRRQFEVNSVGPLRVTEAFLGQLGAGGKIAIITSRMGSIADNSSGGSYGYRMSKAAVNAAGKSLAHDLAEREIAVNLLHPGWVQTGMTGNSGPLTAEESATGLWQRIDEMAMQNTGKFFHQSGEELPW